MVGKGEKGREGGRRRRWRGDAWEGRGIGGGCSQLPHRRGRGAGSRLTRQSTRSRREAYGLLHHEVGYFTRNTSYLAVPGTPGLE